MAAEVNIFLHALQFQSDLSVILCAARHLSSYLFNPMQELQSDEKVGNDQSCHICLLQVPFRSGAKLRASA